MADFLNDVKVTTKALLVGVQTPGMQAGEGTELLGELQELVENLGLVITGTTLVTLRDRQQPKFLIGSGKAAELMQRAKDEGADLIVIDEELSPAQQRNWEEESGLAVIDRQEVILEISPTAPTPARPYCRWRSPAWSIPSHASRARGPTCPASAVKARWVAKAKPSSSRIAASYATALRG